MNWNNLIAEIASEGFAGASDASITGIEYDSRRVRPGSVFVAMRGGTTDGNRFVEKAIASGALGIITDSSPTFDHLLVYHAGLPLLEVAHGRRALAQASAAFFNHPERKLAATGITGTNGKTTTAFLTESLLNHVQCKTVLVGTIEYHIAGQIRPSVHTTPESRDLFELMAEGAAQGATELITEVSSHALDQGRAIGIAFDVAIFTNLTRDHLDYHGTMDKYFAAKRLLFDGTRYPAPRVAVINAHDPRAEELAIAASKAGAEVRTYGIAQGDWRACSYKLTPSGAEIALETPFGSASIQSHLAGEVNILNLLAAFSAAHARGVPFDQLIASVPLLKPVPGRFQPVHAGQPFSVIVDYAHTDDALRNLISLARKGVATGHRVITMFGCGGDRDRTKRPKMGHAAGEGSDFVAATSDNPRSEDPLAILAEIEPALKATGTPYIIEPDRAAAIHLALEAAKPGDVVLLAGKGHETEQILADRTIHFDDAEVARSVLAELGYGLSYGETQ
ncbi:UDP-N-acetylmuramoyl-L-alanyl-D-glutamate--2,6-diaminopimelate ligase [Terracidiphilus gabretensis]|uniref:UDP-N-acetylmuramoyl-L-alanyl-D-glutamate--2, 6-diaminopimelate ligase n=1 Tax=Terracidiphilus gabretensis TaxID=1577687 RepID=UPI00071B02FA|nr:UDP-N-acetylmuramoyl-L-alanyl-D-glutamate--2,6-diaminopimelate ligase [Terracidiphilus gabretensis]